MKHYMLFPAILFCLSITTALAQPTTNSWHRMEQTGLTGTTFKMPAPLRPHVMFGFSGAIYPGMSTPENLFSTTQFGQLEEAFYTQTGLLDQLTGPLGGEAWIGTLSAPGTFSETATTPLRSYGLEAIVPIGQHLATEFAVYKGSFSTSTTFPVTVIQFMDVTNPGTEVQQLTGTAKTSVSQFQAQASIRYYLFSKQIVQPFVGIGAQYSQQKTSTPSAVLAGLDWAFGSEKSNKYFSGFAQAGLSVQPRKIPVFLELSASYQKPFGQHTPGQKFRLEMAIGLKL